MEEYPSNTYKSKEQKTTKVVTGSTTTKDAKRSFFGEMFAKDAADIKEYIIFEVLLPKAKDLLFDLIDNSASMIIFGDGRKSSRKNNNTYISYNSYSNPTRASSQAGTTSHRSDQIKDIIFDDPADAERVLDGLMDILNQYDMVSVRDYYELCDQSGLVTPQDSSYGWKSLSSAKRDRVREGYVLRLPRPIPLN